MFGCMGRWMDVWMGVIGWVCRWVYVWMAVYGWVDGRVNSIGGWMDGWMTIHVTNVTNSLRDI